MKRLALIFLVIGIGSATACGHGGGDRGGKFAPAEINYPLSGFDLRLHVRPTTADGAARQLGARVADVDGVAAAEVDYAERLIQVALEPGLSTSDRDRVTGSLRALDGLVSVEVGP